MTDNQEAEEPVITKKAVKKTRARRMNVAITELEQRTIESLGFNMEWLRPLAHRYGFDKYEYMDKFKSFRCYIKSVHVEWIDINDLSLLNGGRKLTTILLKHQQLSPKRQLIKYNWR